MTDRRTDRWPPQTRPRRDMTSLYVAGLAALIAAGMVLAVFFPPIEGVKSGVPVSRKLATLDYPATVVRTVAQPLGGAWTLPADAVALGQTTFVLDTGNKRILALDATGRMTAVLDAGAGLDLRQPMAVASDGSRMFVADSLAGEIVVLDPSGVMEMALQIEVRAWEKPARPIGVAIGPDGSLVVSDAENHRVIVLDQAGGELHAFGAGGRLGGAQGLNVPAGVTVDGDGYIYVVDTLNGRIVKLSPRAEFIRDFASLGATAGSLARPKDVALDAAGRLYVSDGLQAAVKVFGPDGEYLGVIGRREPANPAAGSIFEAPSGLLLTGDTLTVVDGVLGLIVLRLPAADGDTEGQ
jgi:DNA-binding beta-propeller fold protein YncE